MIKKRDLVLIRANAAGVHFGELVEMGNLSAGGKEVTLKNARRLWKWHGALSLSEIAKKGIDIKNSKISEPVEEIILPTAIEIIFVSKQSNLHEI